MGYDRYDREGFRGQSQGGYGRDREQGRDVSGRDYGRQDQGRQDYGRSVRDYGRQPQGYDYDDRGFFDRAGDEVRSWFGDEDAERRRRMDERHDERFRDRDDSRSYGQGSGNYGRSDYGSSDYGRSGSDQSGYGRSDAGQSGGRSSAYGRGTGDDGRSGGGYGADRFRDHDDSRRYGPGSVSNYGQGDLSRETRNDRGGSQDHDPSYRNWRDRQMETFDRDYEDYRRENQSRFDSEFSQWRTKREGQRRHMTNVREHQEVVGSDGQHVGTVDHVQGDRIKLTRTDRDAGGQHHFIPTSWIEHVDEKVTINKTAAEAKGHWTDEARNSGSQMFGRDDDRDRTRDSTTRETNRGGQSPSQRTGIEAGAGQTATGGQTAGTQSTGANTAGSSPTGTDRA